MSLSIVQAAPEDLKKETVNACWNWVWLECVHGYKYKDISPEEIRHKFVDKAVRLAKVLGEGFDNITQDEVKQIHLCPL